jgi:hypothetical protein
MSVLKPKFFTIFDNEPIADVCSSPLELCFSYHWDLQLIKTGADGNPLISVEASNDGVNWNEYNACAGDVLMNQDSIRFIDDMLPSKFIRVCMKANGVTTGTMTALLMLKDG